MLFFFLGLSDFSTKGEPREAVVAQQMLVEGDWILPRNNGGEMAYKPPFFHWCVAAVSYLGGRVTEYTSRVPSAVAFLWMVCAVFLFYARRRDEGTAFIAALVSLTSFELYRAAVSCRVDMVLTALIVGALLELFKWYEGRLRGVPWLAVLLMSAATLTKGPVGSLLPCLVVGIFLLLRGVNFFRAFFSLSAWCLMSFVLPALWYFLAWQRGGEEFLSLVMEENIGRLTGTMSYVSHENSLWYNFLTLFAGFLPWTILGLFALVTFRLEGLSSLWRRCVARGGSFWGFVRGRVDAVRLFTVLSIVVVFVFYCIPKSKRSVYLMPVYPFVAYYVAMLFVWLGENRRRVVGLYARVLVGLSLLFVVVLVALRFGLVPDAWFGGRHASELVATLRAVSAVGLLPVVILLVGVFVGVWSLRRECCSAGVSVLVLTFMIYMGLYSSVVPAVMNVKSSRRFAAMVDSAAPVSDGVLYEFFGSNVGSKGDDIHYFGVNFYLKDRICDFYDVKPEEGFLLIPMRDVDEWMPVFESEGYVMELLLQSDVRINRRITNLYRFRREVGV